MTNKNKHTSKFTWNDLYSEAALYKAAVRLYTKPIFNPQQRWQHSHDGQTFDDFALKGIKNIDAIHAKLQQQKFVYGPGEARHYEINNKQRTLYIYPWAERLVDLMLYRELGQRFDHMYHPNSFAYRLSGLGVNDCHKQIRKDLQQTGTPVYVIKRDIKNYFDSIDHATCLEILSQYVPTDDYLFEILASRVMFSFMDAGELIQAQKGVPFGTAISCFFANLFLNDIDHKLNRIHNLSAYRYADDFLILSKSEKSSLNAIDLFENEVQHRKLEFKTTHTQNMLIGDISNQTFNQVYQFDHLGLCYSANGQVTISKEKFRKICSLFKDALKANKQKYKKIINIKKRAKIATKICRKVINTGLNGIALIDYYLLNVKDDDCWQRLDLWLAEECLHWAFGHGHKKSHFKAVTFKQLRDMGLPSLVHRKTLIQHGQIESAFLLWKNRNTENSLPGVANSKHSLSALFS